MKLLAKIAYAMTRREFSRLLAAVAVAVPSRSAEKLEWSAEKAGGLDLERRYRADAQILLLGISVLRREGVGGGSARWREFDSAGPVRLLEFNGYSLPEHAAVLNRLGLIREMQRSSSGVECIYFGVMTASPEESAEEARKALHSTAKEQTYTAIDARIAPAGTETSIAHFVAPAAINGARSSELVQRAHQALVSAAQPVSTGREGPGLRPFLQTLADLMLRPDGSEDRYTYAGHSYRLQLSRTADPKSTEYFRECKLIADSVQVVRIAGRLRREVGGKEIDFRVWIPANGDRPIPLRVEYQAKSYLRLVFEAAGA